MVPKKVFFTKGVGIHKDRLASFELALRKAGIEKCNLVMVSSILPPNCEIISKDEGVKQLKAGQITFCVMARSETNEPNRLVSAAIGLAVPKDRDNYGYLSEHHGHGQTDSKSGEYAEDLAATMLATTLGIEFNSDTAWEEREQSYKASGKIFKTTNICQSAEGHKDGLWTTVITVAVFIPQDEPQENIPLRTRAIPHPEQMQTLGNSASNSNHAPQHIPAPEGSTSQEIPKTNGHTSSTN
jgi:arginine decarboxylase